MNIYLHSVSPAFVSQLPTNSTWVKPVIYLIALVAVGILLATCVYFSRSHLKDRLWKVAPVATDKKDELPQEKQFPTLTFAELLNNSDQFAARIPFPTSDNLMKNFAVTESIQQDILAHAKDSAPLLPQQVWDFIPRFLDFKKQHGTAKEKDLYREMTPEQFVDRLIKKRPLMFMTGADSYVLRNGAKGAGGFERIGQDDEAGDLCLADYQSYFEMSLAAFLSMVIPTHFINNGSRNNRGIKGADGTFEPEGIYVGMVGTRFEKPGLMEWAHMVITQTQNTAAKGYGLQADPLNPKTIELRLWAELYQSKVGDTYAFPDYATVAKDTTGRYLKIAKGYLDTVVYKERMRLIVESFLYEANQRAAGAGKKAYLHIVGLGLGVWMIDTAQTDLLLDVYADVLERNEFPNISDIDFSWFGSKQKWKGVDDQIKIHFSKRNPADKLTGVDEGKLLIAQYAWDANAYPGNEYWDGMLTASGDPAAACCSMIPELQNPEINPYLNGTHVSIMPDIERG